MSAEKFDNGSEVSSEPSGEPSGKVMRAPYEPPRIEKRRSVARVTLLSGMGVMSVGVTMTP